MNDLPEGWEWSTLGELCDLVRGVTFKKAESSTTEVTGSVPIIRAGNLSESGIDFDHDLVWVPSERVSSSQRLRQGDIVVATSSGSIRVVGKSVRVRADWGGAHGAFMSVLRPTAGIDAGFAGWYVRSSVVRSRWSDLAKGTNINNLKRGHLQDTPIPVPPLPEQRRIVTAIEEHFSRLDAAEKALEIALQRLDALRQSTTAELLSSDQWGWTTLGEVAEIKGGVTKDSKRQDDPEFVEVPFLRVANVQRGFLDLAEVKSIRVPAMKAEALALQEGDILFNEGGDRDKLGRGWVWEGQVERCIHQNHVFRARLLTDDFDPRFISTHGNTWGKDWFEENGRQTTNLASLNLTTLKRFPVPAAPIAQQKVIVEELERLDQLIGQAEGEVVLSRRRGAALRRSVLGAAFSGRLVPQDPLDEPASVLLERIAAERAAAEPTRRKTGAAINA